MSDRLLGAHVSTAGGLDTSIKEAIRLGINSIQIHPAPPQRWNLSPFKVGVEKKFNELKATSPLKKLFFHGIYLINLATPEPEHLDKSIKSLVHYLDLIHRMEGEGVIFHVGSLNKEPDEEIGWRRIADSIDKILEQAPKGDLILEVAAGAGKVVGSKMEHLAKIRNMVNSKERVFFALDTQHLFASGYDFVSDIDNFVVSVDQLLELKLLKAIHLNDSKSALGSKRDLHQNLGEGNIGLEGIKAILNHQKLREIPFILETPGLKTEEGGVLEVNKLKELAV